MVVSAAVALFVTATLGAALLGFWDHPERRRVDRRSFALAALHVAVASVAVVAWVVYLIGRSSGIGQSALAVLVAAAVLGAVTFASTWRGDRGSRYSATPGRVPAAVLALHGAAAAVAIVLAATTVSG